jgi:hypothetical protein
MQQIQFKRNSFLDQIGLTDRLSVLLDHGTKTLHHKKSTKESARQQQQFSPTSHIPFQVLKLMTPI